MASGGGEGSDPGGASTLDTWLGPDGREVDEAPPAAMPTLTIAYHADVGRIGDRATLVELGAGQPAFLSRVTPPFQSRSRDTAAPLADRNLSRNPLRLTGLSGGGVRIDPGECRTRVSVGGEPLEGPVDLAAAQVGRGVVLELGGRVVLLLHHAASAGTTSAPFASQAIDPVSADLLGESWAMSRLRRSIRRVADLDLPVLIRGESGSGKELVARAVHQASARRAGPFVAVNLAAIPGSLAISELFGADRGSFTGSVKRQPGYFAQARGGTLFLDEIGEAPTEIQVALLRALETGEIQAVGAQQPHKVDVRILAATDADLHAKIAEGAFRAPLLYRLAAYELWVPPLRDRRDDIGILLVGFLSEELARVSEAHRLRDPPERGELWVPASLVARLVDYDWPGNVRQLRNVVRQLVIGNRGRSRVEMGPELAHLLEGSPPPSPHAAAGNAPAASAPAARAEAPDPPRATPSDRRRPSDVTEAELEEALASSRYNLSVAAGLLRISRPSLYMLLDGNERFRMPGHLSAEEIARAHEECGGDLDRMVPRLRISEMALRRRLRELGMEAAEPSDGGRRSRRG